MPTAYALLRRALRLIGAIDPAEVMTAEEGQDALESFNAMLRSWRIENLLVYDILRVEFPIVAGTQLYTLGPGGTWSTTAALGAQTQRPPKIEAIGLLDDSTSPTLEDPMTPMRRYDYQQKRQKGLTSSWPTEYYYQPTVPLGTVLLWPVPTENMEVAVYLWRSINPVATIQTDLLLPDGYEDALVYNLALRLAPEYTVQVNPLVVETARMTKGYVMTMNSEPSYADLDPLVPGIARGQAWNYITDEPA